MFETNLGCLPHYLFFFFKIPSLKADVQMPPMRHPLHIHTHTHVHTHTQTHTHTHTHTLLHTLKKQTSLLWKKKCKRLKRLKSHVHYTCRKPCFFTILGQGFIQAVLVMSNFEKRLSFWIVLQWKWGRSRLMGKPQWEVRRQCL